MELFSATRQWSTRPIDQRFPTLQALLAATKGYANSAGERHMTFGDIRTEAFDATGQDDAPGDVRIISKANNPARLTHWAFGQLCNKIGTGRLGGCPAAYLRALPATLAVQNLNHGLKSLSRAAKDSKVNLLFHSNGDLLLRAITSEQYARIW